MESFSNHITSIHECKVVLKKKLNSSFSIIIFKNSNFIFCSINFLLKKVYLFCYVHRAYSNHQRTNVKHKIHLHFRCHTKTKIATKWLDKNCCTSSKSNELVMNYWECLIKILKQIIVCLTNGELLTNFKMIFILKFTKKKTRTSVLKSFHQWTGSFQ